MWEYTSAVICILPCPRRSCKYFILAPASSCNTADGDHSHTTSIPSHKHQVNIPSHSHSLTIPAHTHSVTIPDHTHQISIPNHTHEINIPNHIHTITLPDHTHDIQHGIYKLSEKPGRVTIKVDGNIVPVDSKSA